MSDQTAISTDGPGGPSAEDQAVERLRRLGLDFIETLHEIGGTDPAGYKLASRDLELARDHIEDAIYRGVRHVIC